jgi:hypothetical protein
MSLCLRRPMLAQRSRAKRRAWPECNACIPCMLLLAHMALCLQVCNRRDAVCQRWPDPQQLLPGSSGRAPCSECIATLMCVCARACVWWGACGNGGHRRARYGGASCTASLADPLGQSQQDATSASSLARRRLVRRRCVLHSLHMRCTAAAPAYRVPPGRCTCWWTPAYPTAPSKWRPTSRATWPWATSRWRRSSWRCRPT